MTGWVIVGGGGGGIGLDPGMGGSRLTGLEDAGELPPGVGSERGDVGSPGEVAERAKVVQWSGMIKDASEMCVRLWLRERDELDSIDLCVSPRSSTCFL